MNEYVLLDSQRQFARMLPDIKGFAHFRFALLDPEGSATSEMAETIGVSSPRICQLKNSPGKKLREFFGPGMRSPLVRRPLFKTSAAYEHLRTQLLSK